MSEIRYNQLYDTHVIIAHERLHRPDHLAVTKNQEAIPETCPFCEGNEWMTPPEIFASYDTEREENKPSWQTRVVPNLYKAVQIETPKQWHTKGFFNFWEGFGAHEVIIDTPNHHPMTKWSEDEVFKWLETMGHRVADLRRDHRLQFISLFKNQGTMAGATQSHPHTQLIALPFVPKQERERFKRVHAHYEYTKEALLSSLIKQELEEKTRIIKIHQGFSAYCPYASEFPFEVMISSEDYKGHIDTLDEYARQSIAQLLVTVLQQMQRQLGDFDFNIAISTPPLQQESLEEGSLEAMNEACRFAIRILPRINRLGGFEVSSGVMINPVLPETAAQQLREHLNG
jgi:UDPglucose--hexose-1-phosphate uridylyltransferase